MRTVKEVSQLAGVSVRTLHHYDAIGLLKPTQVTPAGYRLYDDGALERLQSILLFRELQFPLKEIRQILDGPNFDPAEALEQQIRLLEVQRKRISELIAFAREIQQRGVDPMGFEAFDKREIEQYKAEARARWGETPAHREFARRDASGFEAAGEGLMQLFAELGALRQLQPADPQVQARIEDLRGYISAHFYTCTPEILRGLGQMYTGDERFRRNINRAGGEGTAEFAARAIEAHCAAKE